MLFNVQAVDVAFWKESQKRLHKWVDDQTRPSRRNAALFAVACKARSNRVVARYGKLPSTKMGDSTEMQAPLGPLSTSQVRRLWIDWLQRQGNAKQTRKPMTEEVC